MLRILLIIVSLLVCGSLRATDRTSLPVVSLADVPPQLLLGAYAGIVRDRAGILTPDEVLERVRDGQFERSHRTSINFGVDPAVQWVIVRLSQPDSNKTYFLTNTFTITDRLKVYQVYDGVIRELGQQGDQEPISKRAVITRHAVFQVHLARGEHYLLLRTEANGALQLIASLWQPDAFHQRNGWEMAIIGFLLGFHVVIALYNLFLFFSFREPTYLSYAFYVMGNVLYQATNMGVLQFLNYKLFSWETVDNRILIFSVDFIIVSAIFFSVELLGLREKMPRVLPLFWVLSGLALINMVINLFVSNYLAAVACIGNSLITIPLLLVVGILRSTQGDKLAYFYSLAFFSYLTGAGINVMSLAGLIPVTEYAEWAQLLGGAIEVVLLSLAVGHRMSRIKGHLVQVLAERRQMQQVVQSAQLILAPESNEIFMRHMQFALYNQTAETVGGDLMGMYVVESKTRVYFWIGDVTGHGLDSALMSVIATGAIRGAASRQLAAEEPDEHHGLERIAQAVNMAIFEHCQAASCYITFAIFALDWVKGEVSYLNAGHTPAYRVSGSDIKPLVMPGSMLGMRTDPSFQVRSLMLEPGDFLFLYTDGLIENHAPGGRPIKSRELMRVLDGVGEPEKVKARILQLMQDKWGQAPLEDDLSFLLVRWLSKDHKRQSA